MMKKILPNLFTGILVLCALVVTTLLVRRELTGKAAAPGTAQVQNWERIAAAGNRLGSKSAPVTIIEFSDFQCPFCAQAHQELKKVRAAHGAEVSVVFRHFPLPSHAHAFDAAVASECAAEQGAFDAYHDRLFSLQDSVGVRAWDAFAADARVADIPAFNRCLESPPVRARVERDRRLAAGLGTRGTPTFIVNGTMFKGSLTAREWEPWIAKALADAK